MATIKIGKNAIENLTTGMYYDSKVIYREYIQNAADSIDIACKDGIYEYDEKPRIDIDLDSIKRVIKIIDNAYGVKASHIRKKLADVADSDKLRGVDKGFRGIGRLGGLGYCDTLRFITSYPGEPIKSTMTWNAKELRSMINDPTVKDSAEELLDKVISYSEEECSPEVHYFIVELDNINDENRDLLNVDKVKKYLSANAPVDYNSMFHLKSQIKKYISENKLNFSEYNIFVQGEDVFKEYNTKLYDKSGGLLNPYDKIQSLVFKEFRNNNNELLAWMWYGVSSFVKMIPPEVNPMRGIRLRRDNIQIGDEYTLVNLNIFTEQRGNFYFIGELHATHKDLIPNARRDYFNENSTRIEFEKEIKEYFKNLQENYRAGSIAKSYFEKLTDLTNLEECTRKKETEGFISGADEKDLQEQIDKAKKAVEKTKKAYDGKKENSKNNPIISKIINSIEEKYISNSSPINTPPTNGTSKITIQIDIPPINTTPKKTPPKSTPPKSNPSEDVLPSDTPQKSPLLTDKLLNLTEEERKLVGRIYEVIRKCLPSKTGMNLIQKIQDELNKNES